MKLTIGQNYLIRQPRNLGMCFFVHYCPNCGEKIFLTYEEANLFLANSSLYLKKISLGKYLLRKLTFKLPKIRIIIGERGENGAVDNLSIDNKFGYGKMELVERTCGKLYGK